MIKHAFLMYEEPEDEDLPEGPPEDDF